MAALFAATGAGAEDQHQTCVDVKVGTAQSYECLNERLAAMARQPHAVVPGAPYSANSPSNVTGQFNESATRNRLGGNFGRSVTPERPAPATPPAFPH